MNIFNFGAGNSPIAQSMEPGKDYLVVKDGNQYEFQILNLNNERWMPTSGIIEFTPLRTSKRHINDITIGPIRDTETGLLIGIPLGVDNKNKQIIWQKVVIKGTVAYDLSIPSQRAEAIIVSKSYFVQGSPNFRSGSKVAYRKVDKEQEAHAFIKNRSTKRKAEDLAEGLQGQALYDMCYAIGKDPKFMSPITVQKEVILFAEADPVKFLDIFNSESRQAYVVLKKGISVGLIDHNLDRGYTYNGVSMGYNEDEAVDFLKKNTSTLSSIDVQAKKKEDATYRTMSETFKKEALDTMDEKDVKIAKLEEEIRRAKAEKEKASSIAAELSSREILVSEDPEFAELLETAKKLKIQGAHLIKDKEKLRGKIQEVKAKAEN